MVAPACLGLLTTMMAGAHESDAKAVGLHIEAQPVLTALQRLGEQTGVQVLMRVNGTTAQATEVPAVNGDFTVREALERMLSKTGLSYEFINSRTVRVSERVAARGDDSVSARPISTSFRLAQATNVADTEDQGVVQRQADAGLQAGLEEVLVLGAKRKFAPTDSIAATKIPMDVVDTPQAMTVLSSELMGIVGVNSIHSAAALTPSVLDQENETPIFIDTVARGFEVDWWNGNKIEGMPFQNGGGPIDFGIVERMDVVRGPASIIYGQSDYGATLNLTLKKPQAKRRFAGEIGGSSEGGYRALVDVTGALTGDERLRGRLIVIDDDHRTAQDLAFMKTVTVAPSLSWTITDDTTLDVNFFHGDRELRRHYGFGLALDELTGAVSLPNISPKAFLGADFGVSNAIMDFGVATLRHSFGNGWTVVATGATHHTDLTWHEPFTYGYIPQSGELDMSDYWSNQQSYDNSLDLMLSGDFQALGREHTLMLSAYQRNNKFSYFSSCCQSLGSINVYAPQAASFEQIYTVPSDPEDRPFEHVDFYSEHGVRKESGISALVLLHPLERLTALLGVRHTDYKSSLVDYFDRGVSLQSPDSYRDDATTKRLGLVYELVDKVNVYASYSDGVIFHPSQKYPTGSLPPESGEQWEFGTKAELLNRKLMVSAALFQIDRSNVATKDPSQPVNSPFSIAIDGQKHKGLELEAIGEPVPGWNIITSYSYLDVEITDAPDPGMVGQQRANAPHHMVKLYTTYQLLDGPLRGLSLGGGVFYVGKRDVDDFGTFKLPEYTRLDLRLGYDRFDHVSFSLNVVNLTDEKIYTSSANSAAGGIDFQNRRAVLFRTMFQY